MEPQHGSMVWRDAPAQRFDQVSSLPASGTDCEVGEALWILFAVDDGVEHGAAAHAEDVGQNAGDLDVRLFQGFLNSQGVLRNLAHALLARARQSAQLLNSSGREEAGADQAMGEKVGDPHRVVHVGLSTRHVADVLSVRQNELETLLEQVPHGLPVDTRRLHRDVRYAVRSEALREREQLASCRSERANLSVRGFRGAPDAGDDGVLVDVKACAPRVENIHDGSSLSKRREESSSSKSSSRAPGSCDPWPQFGVLAGLRVQLLNGFVTPSERRPRSRRQRKTTAGCEYLAAAPYASSVGDGVPPMENF